jgi:hypothetical protein
MKLSILLGTNRDGLLACARIAQACSWASSDIEVIVRDVSSDARKRDFLAQLRSEYCQVVLAEPCDPPANAAEMLRLAKGDFIFLLTEDDFCFDHAIDELPALIGQHGRDRAVVGVTGGYLIESGQGSSIVGYTNAESDDVTARVAGYLSFGGPNILHHAPLRRETVQRVFEFMDTLPFSLPFHDRVGCLLYLLNGKFVRLKRLLCLYDAKAWEQGDAVQRREIERYRDAGFDPAINMLHWYLCGFEGAVLVRNTDEFLDSPLAQRQAIADRWFSVMFTRFKGQSRLTFDSPFTGEAQKICAKLQASTGQLSFEGMLTGICALIALFSPDGAQRYFDFWKAAIDRGQTASASAEAIAERRAG